MAKNKIKLNIIPSKPVSNEEQEQRLVDYVALLLELQQKQQRKVQNNEAKI